jgi:hypothetical protein
MPCEALRSCHNRTPFLPSLTRAAPGVCAKLSNCFVWFIAWQAGADFIFQDGKLFTNSVPLVTDNLGHDVVIFDTFAHEIGYGGHRFICRRQGNLIGCLPERTMDPPGAKLAGARAV